MKCAFTFNDKNYIAPTKKEALNFLSFWSQGLEISVNNRGYKKRVREFDTTWKLTHIEVAPSYGQLQRIDLSKVEF